MSTSSTLAQQHNRSTTLATAENTLVAHPDATSSSVVNSMPSLQDVPVPTPQLLVAIAQLSSRTSELALPTSVLQLTTATPPQSQLQLAGDVHHFQVWSNNCVIAIERETLHPPAPAVLAQQMQYHRNLRTRVRKLRQQVASYYDRLLMLLAQLSYVELQGLYLVHTWLCQATNAQLQQPLTSSMPVATQASTTECIPIASDIGDNISVPHTYSLGHTCDANMANSLVSYSVTDLAQTIARDQVPESLLAILENQGLMPYYLCLQQLLPHEWQYLVAYYQFVQQVEHAISSQVSLCAAEPASLSMTTPSSATSDLALMQHQLEQRQQSQQPSPPKYIAGFLSTSTEVPTLLLQKHLLSLGYQLCMPVTNMVDHSLTWVAVPHLNLSDHSCFTTGTYGIVEPKLPGFQVTSVAREAELPKASNEAVMISRATSTTHMSGKEQVVNITVADLMCSQQSLSTITPTTAPPIIVPLEQIAVYLVPAMVSDSSGNRLGMGGGYYDRNLAQHQQLVAQALSEPFHTIGLVYDWQQVFALYAQDHDIAVDQVIPLQLGLASLSDGS